jgi:hypothetical protein
MKEKEGIMLDLVKGVLREKLARVHWMEWIYSLDVVFEDILSRRPSKRRSFLEAMVVEELVEVDFSIVTWLFCSRLFDPRFWTAPLHRAVHVLWLSLAAAPTPEYARVPPVSRDHYNCFADSSSFAQPDTD